MREAFRRVSRVLLLAGFVIVTIASGRIIADGYGDSDSGGGWGDKPKTRPADKPKDKPATRPADKPKDKPKHKPKDKGKDKKKSEPTAPNQPEKLISEKWKFKSDKLNEAIKTYEAARKANQDKLAEKEKPLTAARTQKFDEARESLIKVLNQTLEAAVRTGNKKIADNAREAINQVTDKKWFDFRKRLDVKLVQRAVDRRNFVQTLAHKSYFKGRKTIDKSYATAAKRYTAQCLKALRAAELEAKKQSGSEELENIRQAIQWVNRELAADISIPENAVIVMPFEVGDFLTKQTGKKKHQKMTFIEDQSGNKNHATSRKAHHYKYRGRAGSAISLNGKGTCVELPLPKTLHELNQKKYSLVASFRTGKTPKGKKGKDNNYCYNIVTRNGWYEGIAFTREGKFAIWHQFEGKKSVSVTSYKAFKPGKYYHIAGMVDQAKGIIRLYVDGELVGENTFDPKRKPRKFGKDKWYIGSGDPKRKTYRWSAVGQIDEVSIYSRLLDPCEIRALHQRANQGRVLSK